ncbi:glycoside hydrolase family 125 protein [Lapidilactobacillus achengensis]|uniref:Glycoside hydrolase family 125 protein n=1 Tax=Lapidilactobacillus achengensis TaxID=2486000 RepID=A0ABW1UP19_9LACO|nr:glycoside hydrolase family 125 protein [Lapidilactobacillus achengensis]
MTKSYVTPAVRDFVAHVNELCGPKLQNLAQIFDITFTNTLETTLEADEHDNVFVLTGDIPAMWQRDSTAQLRPYLIMAQTDPAVAAVILKVVKRQFFNMDLDPYANAFNLTGNGHGHQSDATEMGPWIWERKYELDSLCYPVQLAYLLYKNTGLTDQFDNTFVSAVKKLLHVIEVEQHHEEASTYRFERTEDRPEDTLTRDGLGAPVGYTGMSWSGFRPSDDACVYGYLVPANMFAVVILNYLKEIFTEIVIDPEIASQANQLATEIQAGIERYGTTTNAAGETVYAYEVDGLGNAVIMDDGNIPNLMSAPYLGYLADDDPTYLATRKTLLSPENPYYYAGKFGAGLGSPHTPPHYIWPIALSIQGLTQSDHAEKLRLLQLLAHTTAGTNMMHEGFDVEDPHNFTREWFSWANMMFCELLLDYLGLSVKK